MPDDQLMEQRGRGMEGLTKFINFSRCGTQEGSRIHRDYRISLLHDLKIKVVE